MLKRENGGEGRRSEMEKIIEKRREQEEKRGRAGKEKIHAEKRREVEKRKENVDKR